MSIDEIIKELERLAEGAEQTASVHWKADQGIKERHEYIASALRDAIALLRTHQDAQPNEPLTLEPVRHGRWKLEPTNPYDDPRYKNRMIKRCSCCGWQNACSYNYCPNCGANMDGEA